MLYLRVAAQNVAVCVLDALLGPVVNGRAACEREAGPNARVGDRERACKRSACDRDGTEVGEFGE